MNNGKNNLLKAWNEMKKRKLKVN